MHFGIALSIKDIFNDIVKVSMKFGAAFSSGMQSWYSKKLFFGGSWLCLGSKIVPICTFSQDITLWLWCGFSFFLFLSSRRVSVGCVRDLKLNEVPSTEPLSQCGSDTLLPAAPPARGLLLQSGRISDHRWAHQSNTLQIEFRKVVYSTLGLLRLSVMLDESLVLGRDLEIQLEVRLVSDSGLLLHTGAKKSQQLSLYLNQGQVTQPCTHTYTRNNLPITLTRLNHF